MAAAGAGPAGRRGPPPGPAPPPEPEKVALAEQFKQDINDFHDVTEGSVLGVQDLFTHIALANGKQPMPQAALAWLCEINKSTPTKDGIPVLTQEMCFNAFARLANPKEPAEAYQEKVISRVRETVIRLRYANKVMPDVKDDIQALHAKVNGNTDKLFAFFRDLLPEEGRGNFNKAVFCHMILKQPPTVEAVRLDDLLRAMHQNMDQNDTVEKIKSCCLKHIEAADAYDDAAFAVPAYGAAEDVSLY